MRVFIALLAIGAAGLVWGCSSTTVNQDFDPTYDFAALKTYDWMSITVGPEVSELKVRRFMAAIETELAAKGYEKGDNPDFMIKTHGQTQQKVNVTDYGYGYGGWGRGWGGGVDVMTYDEGTIFLDFVDAGTNEMFWRGTAVAIVDDSADAAKQEKNFAGVAQKMFAKFPPQ